MPVPEPQAGESQEQFIQRCMSNNTMVVEYKDKDQRLAICYTQWKEK